MVYCKFQTRKSEPEKYYLQLGTKRIGSLENVNKAIMYYLQFRN